MKNVEQKSAGPVEKVRNALAPTDGARKRAVAPTADVSESFRKARSALVQISADFERLRQDAATLVKGAHRTAK